MCGYLRRTFGWESAQLQVKYGTKVSVVFARARALRSSPRGPRTGTGTSTSKACAPRRARATWRKNKSFWRCCDEKGLGGGAKQEEFALLWARRNPVVFDIARARRFHWGWPPTLRVLDRRLSAPPRPALRLPHRGRPVHFATRASGRLRLRCSPRRPGAGRHPRGRLLGERE